MAAARKYRRSTIDEVQEELDDNYANGYTNTLHLSNEKNWMNHGQLYRILRKPESSPPRRSSLTQSFRKDSGYLRASDMNVNNNSRSEFNTFNGWFELDMSGMGLRCLSPEMRNYSHITALYLSNNRLSSLADEVFSELRNLTILDLAYNLLNRIPNVVTQLVYLERLYLQENHINELPLELGRLFRLKDLNIESNPIVSPPASILMNGTEYIISYLRDHMPMPPPPPERRFISYISDKEQSPSVSERDKIRVLSYNVLSEQYAGPEQYPYCPSWALDWNYRKQGILKELLSYECDVLCLQEVEAGKFTDFFEVELSKHSYTGMFVSKSRARTMEDSSGVDGCAIFYKKDKFILVEEHVVEYQGLAMSKHKEFSEEAFARVITRDNVAAIVILQIKDDPTVLNSRAKPRHVLIANTHIHWNPEQKDVKMIQVQMLLEQLASITSPRKNNHHSSNSNLHNWNKIPMVVCGDFNSTVDSGPYELLSTGSVRHRHPDLDPYDYGTYSTNGMKHNFSLGSAYGPINEPAFTNYTGNYVGVLDYLWFSQEAFTVSKVLQPVDEESLRLTRLPNAYMNSDHISLVAEFHFKKGGGAASNT